MSHYTSVKTKIYEDATLIEVLKEMGYEVSYETNMNNSWGGNRRVNFQIVIPNSDNIGFVRKAGERNFSMVVDWFGVKGVSRREFLPKVMREYSKRIVYRQARAMGYRVEQHVNKKDNSIRMVLRKR
ncbi:hypothetical protein LCGC14_1784310 [marine sediment metagenome]|uniref:DUF1257 domain-containing protein n=1 Tax=marine sediment metagenome TaxID=412755 RepID=A0A0F9GUJ9_9ZZZZ